ncbi:MAG: glycoside hydrolase family 127 protein [Bacteroidales bacterium]|nr:glycoside hydrolase family 127 protein [Bacteroidales bacterium]MDT8431720.1 glycoside hydrolase family 127 protein [Bacteroidales bacterium]
MMRNILMICLFMAGMSSCNDNVNTTNGSQGYPISEVPFTSVHVEDQFWSPRFHTHKEVTIPSAFQKCEETGRIDNFKVAGGLQEGVYRGVFPFDDSDVYKIIEGASYLLLIEPDAELEKYIDTIISYIAAAQEPDGYLHTWRTIDPTQPPTTWSGTAQRWSDIGGGHELYNMGHFYEGAVAHYRATGKRTMLDVATKNADLIAETFGPGKIETAPGHQEIEIGLVKLYNVTGEKKYLDLARFFLDMRGQEDIRGSLYGPYSQDHLPVTEQDEAVGHAVRAGYMYTAMADIASLQGDTAYIEALERIWNNVVNKKIYLTGGIGARHAGESFGDNYELPNFTAYNETCAAISNIHWNYRMFLLTGEGKYMDVLERTLYNGMLAGISLTGDHYFYPNPLASDGETPFNMGSCTRSEWFDCSCCPSNNARFLPSVPGYIYAVKDDALFVNLFIGNEADLVIDGKKLTVRQQTEYPWKNIVNITLEPRKSSSFTLLIRIPGWARNEVMPGDLYHYMDQVDGSVMIRVNGEETGYETDQGYAVLEREWKKGDRVEVQFPMEVRRVAAKVKVEADRGKTAIELGPVVYCAEEADQSFDIFKVTGIPEDAAFTRDFNAQLLGGVPVVKTMVPLQADPGAAATMVELSLVPYHLWSNRGVGKMSVWFPAK